MAAFMCVFIYVLFDQLLAIPWPPSVLGDFSPVAEGRDPQRLERFATAPGTRVVGRYSIADEIVGAHRAAEVGPAARAPVIDEAGVADERLEALRLAQRGQLGKPNGRTSLAMCRFGRAVRGNSNIRSRAPT